MSIQIAYEKTEERLERICEDNHLRVEFKRHDYPIVFRFMPLGSGGNAEQVRLEEESGAQATEIGASIEMIFGDELIVQVTKNFTIDDETLCKLKSTAKKLHYLYLQVFYCTYKTAKTNENAGDFD